MHPDPVGDKIRRLSQSETPRVLDMFAGCGGLSLGLSAAGFRIEAAMEIDKLAARSHARNFYRHADASLVKLHAKARDITMIEPDELVKELGLGAPEMAFDVIVGGPAIVNSNFGNATAFQDPLSAQLGARLRF